MVISDGIPVVPWNRKSRNFVPVPKIEANSHNSVPNPSAEENTTRNSVPWSKIVANSRNSVPNLSAEENTARNSFPEFQKIEINSRNAVLNHSVEEKPTQNKTWQPNISIIVSEKTTFDVQTNHFVKLFCCCFVKVIFSTEFHSVPLHSKLRNWLFRGTRNAAE